MVDENDIEFWLPKPKIKTQPRRKYYGTVQYVYRWYTPPMSASGSYYNPYANPGTTTAAY